jgi:hypothetical protein
MFSPAENAEETNYYVHTPGYLKPSYETVAEQEWELADQSVEPGAGIARIAGDGNAQHRDAMTGRGSLY